MADLSTLKPSLSNLDDKTGLDLIIAIRKSRRTSKPPATKAQRSRRQEKKTMVDLVEGLSPEQIEKLINLLEGNNA
jgi:hypothetical protein